MRCIPGKLAILAGAFLFLAGAAAAQSVTGTATYRERIALPPQAELLVELLDVSQADAPSKTMAAKRYRLTGVPAAFSLSYDPALIEDRLSYAIAARVVVGNRVLFRTTQTYPVLTQGGTETAEVVMEIMQAATEVVGETDLFDDSVWEIFELNGRVLTEDGKPTLSFADASQVSVFAGCNRFSGGVEITEDRIDFPPSFAGTLMACPEPVDELERDILEALAVSERFVLADRELGFLNDSGVTVMRLTRR